VITPRENYLRALEFRGPEWVPVTPGILFATWHKYREQLEEIVLEHRWLFPEHERGCVDFDDFPVTSRPDTSYRDEWGCLWRTIHGGRLGQVVEHPLAKRSAFDGYSPPDPDGGIDWEENRRLCEAKRQQGLPVMGVGSNLFDLLIDLRGFENLMVDLATDSDEFHALVDVVWKYNTRLISRWLEIGVDVMYFHGDIGTQRGPMISCQMFQDRIKPLYSDLFTRCRSAGAHVFYSCDGNIAPLIDDLIDCGVSLHDPQYRAHTLSGIAATYGGKMCAQVDLDQQQILPFGSPEEVRLHVQEVVETLEAAAGGLMIYAELQPEYPLRNIRALCEALRKHCFVRGLSG